MLLGAAALAEDATLTVQGTGVVNLDPDMAIVTLGVREVSKDVGEALAAVSQKLTQVVERLRELGVTDEDIRTNAISVYEDFSYGSMDEDVHYAAENSISVTLHDIGSAGETIDAAFGAGASTFSETRFNASDADDAKKRALELSVENARTKADVLAAAAGMKITGIASIAEQDAGYSVFAASNRYEAAMEKAEADVTTPVFSEQIQVSATVTVDYAMAPVE
jgi:uncharacterized protein YggE